jgi:hypothetical protein
MPYRDFRSHQGASAAHRLRHRRRRDATRPFGKPFSEVADVPGWEGYEVPELDDWR